MMSRSREGVDRPFHKLVQMDQINDGPDVTIWLWHKRHRTTPFTDVFNLFKDAKSHHVIKFYLGSSLVGVGCLPRCVDMKGFNQSVRQLDFHWPTRHSFQLFAGIED